MKSAKITADSRTLRYRALNDEMYKEAKYVEAMFRYTNTTHCFPMQYRNLKAYIRVREHGAVSPYLENKTRDFISQYGYSSQFWLELKRTRVIRQKTKDRIYFLLRSIQNKNRIKKGRKFSITDNNRLASFAAASRTLLMRLDYAPLTDNQYTFMVRTEHILGIYWTDLSQGENGLAPRKEEDKWRLEK